MQLVIITALGVGGATVLGAFIGMLLKRVPHQFNDGIMGFAAGIMLAAAVLGLIIPAAEITGVLGIWKVVLGIIIGAIFLNLMDKVMPHLHHISGSAEPTENYAEETHINNANLNKVMLFVFAIAIHNLPEGLAAGVGFGTGDINGAMTVALGIALQNIPEGMVIITPMLLAGVSKGRTFAIAAGTGLVEVVGTFLGYFAASISAAVLPFALAFAGGTMLYVISDEMIPETHAHGYEQLATYSLLTGFIVMLVMDTLLG